MLNLHDNPLFAHLTRGSRWPSFKVTLLLTVGAGGALCVVWLLASEGWRERFGGTVVSAAVVALLASPLIFNYVGASFTRRELHGEAFQLLRLTPLSRRAIVEGFVFAWLYRLRLLLALVVALSPALVLDSYQQAQSRARNGCVIFVSPQDARQIRQRLEAAFRDDTEHSTYSGYAAVPQLASCVPSSDSRLLWGPLLAGLLVVAAWGLNGLVVALGVSLTLWRPANPLALAVGAVLAAVGVILALTFAGQSLLLPSVTFSCPLLYSSPCMYTYTYVAVWPPPFPTAALAALLVYPAAWGVMRLAGRGG